MSQDDADVIDFIRGARGPFAIDEAASELAYLGRAGADWPQASATHWKREFERLVDKGLLNLNNGFLTVAKPEQLTQKSLFDL
jgi:hypothetical protein